MMGKARPNSRDVLMILSATKQQALEKAQKYFRAANLHPSSQEFRSKCLDDQTFYDGTGQWLERDLQELKLREQLPITVNICKGYVDALSGVEIQSRYRTACRSDSHRPEDDKLAEALTHWLFYIQEHQDLPYKGSLKFRDSLICGIGWGHLCKEDGVYYYDYVHPFNVIPDPDDLSPQYTAMKYVCRKRWMSPDMVRVRWRTQVSGASPSTSRQARSSGQGSDENSGFYGGSPELDDRNSSYTDSNTPASANQGADLRQNRVLVVEVQYKVPHKAYKGIDRDGRPFETFDLDVAEKLSHSTKETGPPGTDKSGTDGPGTDGPGTDGSGTGPPGIEETDSTRIMRTLFLGDTLLEHAPLDFALPGSKDFSLIPIVYQRRFKTGVPYGLLESMKDIQRDCNVRVTKSVYALNSSQLVFEGNPMPGADLNRLKRELKSSDSVIILPKDSKYQLSSNAQLGEGQLKIVELYLNLIQRVTGIHDEMLGMQTNAASGVAQNIRQVNSVRNNVFAFDNFSQMKKRESQFILGMLQSGDDENIAVQILTPEEKQVMVLNLSRTIKGGSGKLEKVILNNVRTLPLSLYIEEVPDYKSTFEEQKATFEALLSNAHAHWMMLSPELLRRLGVRDPEKIAQEMRQALQEKGMMEQNIAGRPPPGASQSGAQGGAQQPDTLM
jgi:hypothetical protein